METINGAVTVRERILNVAARLFVSEGYHGISMREIAQAVGVSKAGLYYHFQDKEALFLGVLTANLERVERIIVESREQAEGTRERITRLVYGIFALPPEQRAIIRLATQEISHLQPETQQAFARLYQRKFVDQIEAVFGEGVERGELRSINPRVATWALLGMLYPLLYPVHERYISSEPAVLEQMLDIFFSGVLAERKPDMN